MDVQSLVGNKQKEQGDSAHNSWCRETETGLWVARVRTMASCVSLLNAGRKQSHKSLELNWTPTRVKSCSAVSAKRKTVTSGKGWIIIMI